MRTELISPPAIYGDAIAGDKQAARAEAVKQQITDLKNSMSDSEFTIGDLLAEAKENNYSRLWGYDNFKDYVEAETPFRERQCYYLIKIVTNSRLLGIERPALRAAGMSKLKVIFTLDPGLFSKEIVRLVEASATVSLDAIIEEVRRLKRKAGEPDMMVRVFHLTREAAESVVDKALEAAKLEAGTTVDERTGEETEISSGRALEFIAAEFNADGNRYQQQLANEFGEGVAEEEKE